MYTTIKQDREDPILTTVGGSMADPAVRAQVAELIKDGGSVGAFVRAVWVMWIDGANRQAVETIYRVKGERRIGRPMVTTLDAATFVELLDPDKIPAEVRKIFLDPEELETRLGMLCLIRAPLRASAVARVPPALVSQTDDGTRWMQTCVPAGAEPGSRLIYTLLEHGIRFPAVTSMNVSGRPEIVDAREAEAFCRAQGIPFVPADSADKQVVSGSFPIIEVGATGVKLLREGHFPGYLFRYLLDGADVQLTGAVPAKFPLAHTHSAEEAARTSAKQLRLEIIARLTGTA